MTTRIINVIGAGSLGSFTILLLSKMAELFECPIRILDFDTVETHNTRNQLYQESDIGLLKVEALGRIIKNLYGIELIIENKKVGREDDLRGIVIVAVDKMSVRKEIFEACKFNFGTDYLIEARIRENHAMVYAFDPKISRWDNRYSHFLYEDINGANLCATSQTIPTLWVAAAIMVNILVKYRNQTVFTNTFYESIINFEDWPSIVSEAHLDI